MILKEYLKYQMDKIKAGNLYRRQTILENPAAVRVKIGGVNYLNLCSNNYLALADHPDIKQAAKEAIDACGTGSTGSRLITGTTPLHDQLERQLAAFKGADAAMFISSGYVANLSTIAALLDDNDVIFSDELNHASIIDGIKLSRANKYIYKHKDSAHLEELLVSHRSNYSKAMIITDTIFSMDGDRCLLKELISLKEKHDAFIMIDEAHATGVIGHNGSGLASELNLTSKIDIQMGTFSKALGVEGGYIAGSRDLIDFLRHKSRGYVFSTAPSPAIAGAVLKAIEIVSIDPAPRKKLWTLVNSFKEKIVSIPSISLIPNDSPIFCLNVGDIDRTVLFENLMAEDYQIFVKAIRPPTVKTSRLRICLNAALSEDDLDYITCAISQCANKN